jgi:hypothetical protein
VRGTGSWQSDGLDSGKDGRTSETTLESSDWTEDRNEGSGGEAGGGETDESAEWDDPATDWRTQTGVRVRDTKPYPSNLSCTPAEQIYSTPNTKHPTP